MRVFKTFQFHHDFQKFFLHLFGEIIIFTSSFEIIIISWKANLITISIYYIVMITIER